MNVMEHFSGFSDHEMAEKSKRVLMCNKLERQRYLETCQRLDRANVRQLRAYDAEMSDLRKELHRFTQAKRSMRPPDDSPERLSTVASPERVQENISPRSPRYKAKQGSKTIVGTNIGTELAKSAVTLSASKTKSDSVRKLDEPSESVKDPVESNGVDEHLSKRLPSNSVVNSGLEEDPIPFRAKLRAYRKTAGKTKMPQIFYNRSSVMNNKGKQETLIKQQTATKSEPRPLTADSIISAVADSNKGLMPSPPDIELPSYIKPPRLGKIDESDESSERESITVSLTPSPQQGKTGTSDFSQSAGLLRGLEWLSNQMRQSALRTDDTVTAAFPESFSTDVPHVGNSNISDTPLPPIALGKTSTDSDGNASSHLGNLEVDDILSYTRQQERSARTNRYRVNSAALHYLGEGTFYGLEQGDGAGYGGLAETTRPRRKSDFGQGRHMTVRIEKRRVLRGESNLNRKTLVMK